MKIKLDHYFLVKKKDLYLKNDIQLFFGTTIFFLKEVKQFLIN